MFRECDGSSMFRECNGSSMFKECDGSSMFWECDGSSMFRECDVKKFTESNREILTGLDLENMMNIDLGRNIFK